MSVDRDRRVTVTITAVNEMYVSDVWPDGDAPPVPTASDVLALLSEKGRTRRNIDDWCLLQDLDVEIDVDVPNPHFGQHAVLPGVEPSPERIRSTERLHVR
jgi:hypothetical protein